MKARKQGFVRLDVDQLAFEEADGEADCVIVPLINNTGYVFCDLIKPGRAYLVEKQYGRWWRSRIEEGSASNIHKKLERIHNDNQKSTKNL